ncbi:MAG TPA: hypothetical protein VKV17_06545 [Bryobacteraceae bacterium]|nr:hypothetical protein [Bryobacteraceae bacterium]
MQDNPSDGELERELNERAGREAAEISAELQRRVLERLTPSLRPVKPIAAQRLLVLQFFGIFVLSAVGIVPIVGKAGFGLMTDAQIAWMCLVLAGGAALFSVILAGQMVPGRRRGIPVAVVCALSGLAVIAGIGLNFPWMSPGSFVSEGWPCAMLELTIAAPATLVFWLLARRGALFASATLGASLVGMAVFTALAPLQVQCMFLRAPHLLVWHGGTAAVLIGLGALIGSMRHRAVEW